MISVDLTSDLSALPLIRAPYIFPYLHCYPLNSFSLVSGHKLSLSLSINFRFTLVLALNFTSSLICIEKVQTNHPALSTSTQHHQKTYLNFTQQPYISGSRTTMPTKSTAKATQPQRLNVLASTHTGPHLKPPTNFLLGRVNTERNPTTYQKYMRKSAARTNPLSQASIDEVEGECPGTSAKLDTRMDH